MNERAFILRVVKKLEEETGGIAYAYKESNETGSFEFWNVCINDYDRYNSGKFKELLYRFHAESKPYRVKLLFSYCEPIEKNLIELADKGNLIMNV